MEIEMKNGRNYSKHNEVFPKLSSVEEIKGKFRSCVVFAPESLAEGNSEKIMDMVDRLEKVADVSELIKLLVKQKANGR